MSVTVRLEEAATRYGRAGPNLAYHGAMADACVHAGTGSRGANRGPRLSRSTWLFAVVLGVALGLFASPALAQSDLRSASAPFTVSVTVVRACGIATASAASATSAPRADVRISCGQAPSSASVSSATVLPVAGAQAPAAVSTSATASGLVLSVNF